VQSKRLVPDITKKVEILIEKVKIKPLLAWCITDLSEGGKGAVFQNDY